MNSVNNESSSTNTKFVQNEKVDVALDLDNTKKITILIVEDDPVIRKVHELTLRKAGLKPSVAKNGEEAVNLFLSGASFDLVLMDNNMPIMNGPMATMKLRAMGVSTMIVGLTSNDSEEEKQAFMEAGLDDFYAKPLTSAKVANLLEKLKKN